MSLLEDYSNHVLKVINDTGEEKYFKRLNEIQIYLNDFQQEYIQEGTWPSSLHIVKNVTSQQMAEFLNYQYWYQYHLLRNHVTSSKKEYDGRIEHYKIVSLLEYIITKFPPFISDNFELSTEWNVSFAIYVLFRFLIAWNESELQPSQLLKLSTDENTQKFIAEHRIWIMRKDILASPAVVFSNMQTIRLLHYWFREPNENLKALK